MLTKINYQTINKSLDKALLSDKRRILNKAKKIFGNKNKKIDESNISQDDLNELAIECALACEKAQLRNQNIPKIEYPDNLPVSKEKDNLVKLIKENQVVIIAGDTGSGKTTQLPKICLEAGLGRRGYIGHTQTRRLATRTVAKRISDELKVELGTLVGYKIRFTDKVSDNTIIKLMTDGVLLTELERDRYLNDYEVLIIDEAHERSLNIDFILGFLKELLAKRKDLKVIVTSATIELERFSKHFNDAPIKVVEGRTYPVEVIYNPLDEIDLDDGEEEIDEDVLHNGILQAIKMLEHDSYGDILVFLNGERDIAECADFLRKANLKSTEILPLYARLSNQEQNRIFEPHTGRRIVLATNVAETSITVPGIKYVIDPGTARISRYNTRNKVQRLPIEPISQASADQRKGRCGRVQNGICVRLYSEIDYINRKQFTDPEILRTNLSAVILRMLSLHIEDIYSFPFIESPEEKQIRDGLKLLEDLGAVTYIKKKVCKESLTHSKNREDSLKNKINLNDNNLHQERFEIKELPVLTKIGKQMASIPCDPRLARMLIEANEQHALKELLIIVSNLSAQETRERPLQWREAANTAHKRFDNEKSDFISILNLYAYLKDLLKDNSNSAARKIMRKEFLSYLRMREWFDIHTQLEEAIKDLGFKINVEDATYEQVHCSLLCGLLGFIGMKSIQGHEYVGARNNHFYIFPGSGIAKKSPKWIMCGEITETSKLYARNVAEIEPVWCEKYGKDLIKYSYSDEFWSKNQAAVMATCKGVLYGLPIISNRKVNYTRINPSLCRELFIREGLVNGEFNTKAAFLKHNLGLVDEVIELEEKSRRRDLLVSDDALFAFYDERIPDDIAEGRTFETWWNKKSKENSTYLNYDIEMLFQKDSSGVTEDLYPNHYVIKNIRLPLEYNFDPTQENDGVTVIVPISVLNQLEEDDFLWLIPGLRLELYTSLIKSLPKVLRKNFVPAPDYAKKLNDELVPFSGHFWELLCKKMTKYAGTIIEKKDFDLTFLPKHLSFVFRVIDIKRRVLKESRSLEHLKSSLREQVKNSLAIVVKEMPKQEGIKSWDFDSIPKSQKRIHGGMEIIAYPALRDTRDSVSMELFETAEEAEFNMKKGLNRLILLSIPSPLKYLEDKLPNKSKLAMYFNVVGGNVKEFVEDLEMLAITQIVEENGGLAYDKQQFDKLVNIAKSEIYDRVLKLAIIGEKILVRANDLKKVLKGRMDFSTAYAFSDMGAQLKRLICKNFASASGSYYVHLERYLEAMQKRIEKVHIEPNRDLMQLKKIQSCEEEYESLLGRFAGKVIPQDVYDVRFMIEELRVSLFAQVLKTFYPVSDKRVLIEIDKLKKLYH